MVNNPRNYHQFISRESRDPSTRIKPMENPNQDSFIPIRVYLSFGKCNPSQHHSEDEDECLARELLGKLTPAVLSKLRRRFHKAKDRGGDIDSKVEAVMIEAAAQEGIEFSRRLGATPQKEHLWMDEGFVDALDDIFGHHKYTTHAYKLYQLLDPFAHGQVRWRQLVCKLVEVGAKKTSSRADAWIAVNEPAVTRLEHCKRETILKLVSIERNDSFCYAAVSKGGRVGIYSGLLKQVHSYEVFFHRSGITRRVKNCWITDAVYLNDVQYLIYSASDRSLTVYDASTLTHTPVYCITGLPNIPTCLCYCAANSELVLGSERGDVTRLRFLQPRVSLLYTKTSDNINYYFWMELSSPPHTSYCCISMWRGTHARSVRRVRHARPDVLMSCSHDSAASVRARHVPGLIRDYVFKVQRGVSCFHLVPSLHLLVTGSCDGVVRLWENTQPKPFASLSAPAPAAPAVLDVAVLAAREIVVAYCSNCCLHIWDMYEECLLQTIKIKFPCLGVLGKRVEFGTVCIHPGPARKCTSEDEVPADPVSASLGPPSRRGSSVYRGSTGGLILQAEPDERHSKRLEDDPEYIRFNRPELLITCCDYVCTVVLSQEQTDGGPLLPPPGDTLRARRPSFWDLPDDVFAARPSPPPPPSPCPSLPTCLPVPSISYTHLLSPSAAERPPQNLDTLLENAGLQGILEKDFVMMYGLKHDLNRKLADLEANKDAMLAAVSMGAPYIALRTSDPAALGPGDDMMEAYKKVMRLFPGPSVTNTPTGSGTSTPRKRTSQTGAK